MIVWVGTCLEENETTGKMQELVSHGVDTETLEGVVLPCETVDYARREGWLKWSENFKYYTIIRDEEEQ